MAEGVVVVVDGNDSFQNQTKDVARISYSSRSAARKVPSALERASEKEAQRTVF